MTDQLLPKSVTITIPTNETERLAALHRYKILDTPPEAAFDRITTLAARLFNMPTALISLVDESRAWFKSCIGFDAREVPRDVTLCSFSVLTDEPLIIPDTRLEERFACHPFVQSEPGVRFYAGAPLLSRDGFNLGTLCLLDTQPHEPLTAEQQATLVDLAAMVVDELELRLAVHKIAQSEEEYRTLFESISDEGFCVVELFDADGKPSDHRILQANPAFKRQCGIANPEGKRVSELALGLEQPWNTLYTQVINTGKSIRIENRSEALNRWFDIVVSRVGDASLRRVAIVVNDISDRKQAELEIQKFVSLADNSGEFIGICDMNFVPFYVNPAGQQLVGLDDVQQYIETSVRNFFFPEDQDFIINEFFPRVLQEGRAEVEIRFRHFKTGAALWMIYNVFYIRGENNQPIGLATVSRNITERKQAEAILQEQATLLQLIVDTIGDGLILANPQGEFVLVNQAAERIFGRLTNERSCEEWSQTYGLFLPDQQTLFPNEQLPLYRAMRGEQANDVEVFVRRDPAAEGRWISISGFPVFNTSGAITGGVITCRNVTERKRILQQEQAAREEAERANRIKDEFLAVLSHELRSPLNPILGWIRLLRNGKLDPARQIVALATIERNAKLQSQLIEDLLDISRIMQGKLTLTAAPVSLAFVISAAVETVSLAADAKNIQITLDLDREVAPISGDAARLQQVVWNLLTNAVKFTANGGQVTVELRRVDAVGCLIGNQMAQIRVIDTGIGINPQFLPYVFEYFRQEDGSTTRRFGGLGLGLAIVRQIVELHGGTVRAESQGENQGATFIVQLPTLQQATPIGSKPTIPPADTKAPLDKIQILLVDDDTDTLEFQTFLLEQSGAMVTAVTSGLEALQVLEQFMPDAIVSDIGMAEMDGYMLLRQIRSRPPNRGGTIPALALTAYAAEVDHQRAIQAGFQTFITKPVEPEGLILAIISLLERNQQ